MPSTLKNQARSRAMGEQAPVAPLPGVAEIDQSISIVVETAQNPDRANFPSKSKAKVFDGPGVGFSASAEKFCA
jgi:hypothetical protein